MNEHMSQGLQGVVDYTGSGLGVLCRVPCNSLAWTVELPHRNVEKMPLWKIDWAFKN